MNKCKDCKFFKQTEGIWGKCEIGISIQRSFLGREVPKSLVKAEFGCSMFQKIEDDEVYSPSELEDDMIALAIRVNKNTSDIEMIKKRLGL